LSTYGTWIDGGVWGGSADPGRLGPDVELFALERELTAAHLRHATTLAGMG
jgi:hypothetical protein